MTPVVIGPADDILGFALAGVTTLAANGDAEVRRAIERAERKFDDALIILLRNEQIDFVFPDVSHADDRQR